jgi:DNA-binding transcriptional ArsR family regulator
MGVMVKIDPERTTSYELQANMLAVLANPKRLMIMDLLGEGAKTVTEIATALDMTLQNASQHLRLMREQSIVMSQREGQTVTYRLTTTVFKECCETVRRAMVEEVRKKDKHLSGARI